MKRILSLAGLLGLAACSAGSSPASAPTASNRAPAFTSAGSASVLEKTAATTTIYQATATDLDGDALTYTLAGGVDAARFGITAGGALQFLVSPDFDAPSDANGDNIYFVNISVSDGKAAAVVQTLQVTVTNDTRGILVRRIATGYVDPVAIAPRLNTPDRSYVAERSGQIYESNLTTNAREPVIRIGNLSTGGERGILAIAAASDTGNNLFVLCTNPAGAIELRHYQLGTAFDPSAYSVMLTIPHSGSSYSGSLSQEVKSTAPGSIVYDLLVGTDDNGDPLNTSQNPNSLLGKILRLEVIISTASSGGAPSSFTYAPAPENSYSTGGGSPYVYAQGLHAPIVAPVGLEFVDRGATVADEYNILTRTAGVVRNYGWPYREGNQVVMAGGPPNVFDHFGSGSSGVISPFLIIPRGAGPTQTPGLTGITRYASIASLEPIVLSDRGGNLWRLINDGSKTVERRTSDLVPDAGTIDNAVAIAAHGTALYVLDADGELFLVHPSSDGAP